jgi:hypothetical protein
VGVFFFNTTPREFGYTPRLSESSSKTTRLGESSDIAECE